jgi:hypothetical protein
MTPINELNRAGARSGLAFHDSPFRWSFLTLLTADVLTLRVIGEVLQCRKKSAIGTGVLKSVSSMVWTRNCSPTKLKSTFLRFLNWFFSARAIST